MKQHWRRRLRVLIMLGFSLLLLYGCASGGRESIQADRGYASAAPEMELADDAPVQPSTAEGGDRLARVSTSTISEEQPESQERLRVFSADLRVVVSSVQESRRELLMLAEQVGGYVESSQRDYVVLRVPRAEFERAVRAVESQGEVTAKSIRAADVTEQFADLERRLEISETARARLYQLLDRTEDTEERVRIVREIRRLSEQIERLRASLESLNELVNYSRITVRLVARIAGGPGGRSAIPFDWISNLDPLYGSLGEARRAIDFAAPDGFAVFESGKVFSAEAADGTRIRVGAVENEPLGTTEFWSSAVAFHLADFYRASQSLEAGEFSGVIFESKDRPSYSYLVAVRAIDKQIIVAETFFPDQESRSEYLSAILGRLSEVE